MKTREEALKNAKTYLKNKEVVYSSLDDIDAITFKSASEMERPLPAGKYKGEKLDLYTVSFGQLWGLEERGLFIKIDANTGEEVLVITPHGYLEDEG